MRKKPAIEQAASRIVSANDGILLVDLVARVAAEVGASQPYVRFVIGHAPFVREGSERKTRLYAKAAPRKLSWFESMLRWAGV